jgi:hypothetical protein
MKPIDIHADVWVVDQGLAWLLRQDSSVPSGWQKEMGMPLDEFIGSAMALSSFTQTETRVFYNLGPGKALATHLTGKHWLGIKDDPLRLLHAAAGAEQQEIHALQHMGKKVSVIRCADPAQFELGTPMVLINPCEKANLESWVAACQGGSGKKLANAGLLKNLWIKPEPGYQLLRLVAVCCTALTLAMAHHLHDFLNSRQLDSLAKHVQQTLKTRPESTSSPAWKAWSTQLGKFGKEKRANLTAATIHWNEEGQVTTQTVLNKDRKRVPKGCTLENPRRANCSTKGLAP